MDLLDMEYVSAVGNIKNFCADQQQYNSEFLISKELSYCWLRLLLIVKEYISPQSALELKAVLFSTLQYYISFKSTNYGTYSGDCQLVDKQKRFLIKSFLSMYRIY
jgi:hypothetical protein